MKKDDSVFFFTLVDLLLTALFFGLVLFAVGQARASQKAKAEAGLVSQADSLRKATGVSDLTELTDRLTRLGPLRNAEAAVRLVKDAGGPQAAERAVLTVRKAGGSDTVEARLARLQLREGAGKPHCLYHEVNGAEEAIPLATLVATDTTLSFTGDTPDLTPVLARMGKAYADVQSMSLPDFRRTFERLVDLQPECRYTIVFVEHTRIVDARDAVRGIFYMRIRH